MRSGRLFTAGGPSLSRENGFRCVSVALDRHVDVRLVTRSLQYQGCWVVSTFSRLRFDGVK